MSRVPTSGRRRIYWPGAFGIVGMLCVGAGYVVEAYRQTGSCATDDKRPQLLDASMVLILFGGVLVGLVAVAGCAVAIRRRWWPTNILVWNAVPAALSLLGGLSIFLFAGGGAGGHWFEHCGR